MTRITEHQLDVLYRRWRLGSDEAVAADMGISRNTVRNVLYHVRLMLDAVDTMQCTFLLRDDLMARDRLAHLRRARTRATELGDGNVLRKQSAAGGAM